MRGVPLRRRARRCTAVYGIPVQRELIVSWTCGALVCASIGRPPREILQLVLDWLPIVAVLAVYDLTRGAADSLGIGVHSAPMIDFERFVFFGQTPSEWLQSHLYDALRLRRPRRDLPLAAPATGPAAAVAALPAGDGPDPDGDRRALLFDVALGWLYAGAVTGGWSRRERRRAATRIEPAPS
jgi:hypothetical protein